MLFFKSFGGTSWEVPVFSALDVVFIPVIGEASLNENGVVNLALI